MHAALLSAISFIMKRKFKKSMWLNTTKAFSMMNSCRLFEKSSSRKTFSLVCFDSLVGLLKQKAPFNLIHRKYSTQYTRSHTMEAICRYQLVTLIQEMKSGQMWRFSKFCTVSWQDDTSTRFRKHLVGLVASFDGCTKCRVDPSDRVSGPWLGPAFSVSDE